MIRLIALTLFIFALAVPEPVFSNEHKAQHPFEVKKAEWKADENEFRVKGKTSSDGPIFIRYAVDGSPLAEVTPEHDHFFLRMSVADGFDVPCKVLVEQGSDSFLVDVADAPANCARKITVAGRVIDDPIPFAIIQFTIGDQVFSTVADENGFYQIDITTTSTGRLVTADATLPGPEEITLTSIIGPISSLLSSGNPNEVIDSTGTFSTNITNVTTANVALLTQANGGQPITNLTELQEAEKFVDATELLRLAAVIKLIIDDSDFSIPDGFNNLLEFTSDSTAVSEFIATVDPVLFDATLIAIITDGNVLPGFDAANIPAKYYALITPVPGFLARNGEALEFDPGGSGNLLTTDVDGRPINNAYTWQVVDGVLALVFVSPTSRLDFPQVENTTATTQQIIDINCCANSSLIRYTTTLDRDYVLLQNGVLEEKVSIANRIHTTFDPVAIDDDGDSITDRFIQLAESFEIRTNQGSLRDSSQIIPIAFDAALSVTGNWAFQFDYDLGTSAFTGFIGEAVSVDLLTFNADGSGTTKIANTPFTWSESGGVLSLDYLSPSNEAITEQIRLLDTLDGVHGAFYEFTNHVTGVHIGTYGLAIKQDPSFVFTLALMQTAPGTFWNADRLNGQNKDQYDESGEPLFTSHFGWSFDNATDATNYTFFVGEGGDTILDRDMAWDVLVNGDLHIEGGYFGFCIFTLNIRCHERTWTPLFQDSGDGIWYLEEGLTDFSGTLPPVTRHGRPRINGVHNIPIPSADDFLHWPLPPI